MNILIPASPPPPVSWAEQLTAYGTVGAVAVSLVFAAYGVVTASIEKRTRIRAERTQAERSQAERVHWWHELCPVHSLPYEQEEMTLATAYRSRGLDACWGEILVVENTSDAPIHDVVLDTPQYLVINLTTFMPGEIGPHSRREFHIAGFGTSLLDKRFLAVGRISYSDAQGRRWEREKSGTLTPSATSAAEASRNAEATHWLLRHTLEDISTEYDWTSPAEHRIRDAIRWIAISPEPHSERQRRHAWQQLHAADALTFRQLQELHPRRPQRRVAALWWQWRSGSISLRELIVSPGIFYPNESKSLLATLEARSSKLR